jgi:hypothetical protein
MQIFSINNYQPNFKALIIDEKANFTPIQTKIVDNITSVLKQPRKRGEEWKSPLNRAEENGYDVFITKGSDKSSVQVNLATNYKNKKDEVVFTDYVSVGEYSQNEPFNLDTFIDVMLDVESDPKNIILNCLMFAAGITAVMIALFCIGKTSKPVSVNSGVKILKEQVVDTLKTLPEKTLDIRKFLFK